MNWIVKEFKKLTADELYAILQLRSEVFVVEQNCVYQDMDNKDKFSLHVMGWEDDKLIATARLIPPGISYKEPSIGRVVSSKTVRGSGAGRHLMNTAIDFISKQYGSHPVRIGAQLYLKKFYESFGFMQASEIYLEDGIEHIEMVKK